MCDPELTAQTERRLASLERVVGDFSFWAQAVSLKLAAKGVDTPPAPIPPLVITVSVMAAPDLSATSASEMQPGGGA